MPLTTNPKGFTATIFGQTNPASHINALADYIDKGRELVEKRKMDKLLWEKANRDKPYVPDLKEIDDAFLPPLQAKNEAFIQKEVDYRKKGVDWLLPSNIPAWQEQRQTANDLQYDILSAKAFTKMKYNAIDALDSDKDEKLYDHDKSQALLGVFMDPATTNDKRREIMKEHPDLLVAKKFSIDKYYKMYETMLDNMPQMGQTVNDKGLADKFNKQLDPIIEGTMLRSSKMPIDFQMDGGTQAEWDDLRAKILPQFEARKFQYDPTKDQDQALALSKFNYDKENKNKEEEYQKRDQLIQLVQKGDLNSLGAFTNKKVGSKNIIDAEFAQNSEGKTVVKLTLQKANKSSDSKPESTQNKEPETYEIDLTDPKNYIEINNILGDVDIEDLDDYNKKHGQSKVTPNLGFDLNKAVNPGADKSALDGSDL